MFISRDLALSRVSDPLRKVKGMAMLTSLSSLLHECLPRRLVTNSLIIEECESLLSITTNIWLKNNKVNQVVKKSMDMFILFTMGNKLIYDGKR